jgi:hypothetical protein
MKIYFSSLNLTELRLCRATCIVSLPGIKF